MRSFSQDRIVLFGAMPIIGLRQKKMVRNKTPMLLSFATMRGPSLPLCRNTTVQNALKLEKSAIWDWDSLYHRIN